MSETKPKLEEEPCLLAIAEDLYQTLELTAEEHGLTVEEIVDAIFRMAFKAKHLEEILEGMGDG